MEFASLAVDKLLDYTLRPVGRHVGYVIFYKNNVAELKKQAHELQLANERVQHRVNAAKKNGDVIEREVEEWLTEVDEKASKAKELDEDKCHKNAGCSSRSFPNLWWRHQLSRRAKKLAQEIVIKSKKEFPIVSYPAELKIIEIGSSSTTNDEAFESRVFALNQIMEALADPNLNMIGVYGLGGVGKTTLVHQVAKKAKEKSSDLVVVIATVKQNPEMKEIQQQIAEILELELKEQTRVVRAARLRQRLEQEKNVLVILDDLWAKLELKEIGIPDRKENNFKILMTSRNRAVLSDHMNTQKNFQLTELAEAEAWKLFKEKAALNESSESAQLLSIARDVIAECAGLPIAIVTVASSLKGKKISEWKDVLRRLRNHLYSDINAPVEVSYENLEDDRLKSIFVLAGVYPSDWTMYLFRYSCGLGLFHDMNKMEEMQNSFEICIRKLKDSCLLQDSDNSSNWFTMHDVVRDVAISIASRDDQLFLKVNGELGEEEWPKDAKLKSCKTIILYGSNIKKLPGGLNCPNLTFLYIHNNDPSLKLPDNFFKRMLSLKVLDLTEMHFEFLPSSISLLSNMHTLCLDQCVLGDIEIIGELKGLKVLSLSGSEIKHLPREIGQLTKLQLLDLSGCEQLELIPPGVLLNLKMLEVLFIGGRSFDQWATDHQQSTASLSELNDLSHLNNLIVRVPDENMLPKEPLFEKLQLHRYEVVIGDSWVRFGDSEYSRTLKLDLNTGINSKNYFRGLLDRVEDLTLRKLEGAKNVVPEINKKGLLELKQLEVIDNDELQFIADLAGSRDLFPNLESLNVQSSSKLVKLSNGSLTEGSFSKLKVVEVKSCNKMKSLFSFSLPICLPQLNEIRVSDCNSLEGIVSDDGKVVGMLQFAELRTLELESLPALIGFYSKDKTSSKAQQKKMQFADDKDCIEIIDNNSLDRPVALFSEKVIFPNLETLILTRVGKLNKIWDCPGQQFDGSSFRNLKTLTVVDCDSLKYLFPVSVAKALVKLEKLRIRNCSELENIVRRKEEGLDDSISFVFPQVTIMELEDLPKLGRFYPGTYSIEWPLLEELHHGEVNIFGTAFLEKSIPKLKKLTLDSNKSMMTWLERYSILKNLEELHVIACSSFSNLVPSSITFNHLTSLKVFNCDGILHLMASSTAKSLSQLTTMEIRNCKMIKEIIADKVADAEITEEITFNKMKILKLKDLPWLESFCSMNYVFNFPSLENVNIIQCPKMKIFSKQAPNSPKLQIVKYNIWMKGCWEGDLNSTVQKISIYELRHLMISDYPWLKEVWHSRVADWDLHNLSTLTFSKCEWFSKVLTVNLLEHLGSLEELKVESCNSVEVVFDLEGPTIYRTRVSVPCTDLEKLTLTSLPNLKLVWNKDPNWIYSFKWLSVINVSYCHGLKYLFPVSVDKALVQLKKLKIGNCSELENIVGRGKEPDIVSISFVFPKVTFIELRDLPKLKSFYPARYSTEWPVLEELYYVSMNREVNMFGSGLLGIEESHYEDGVEASIQQNLPIEKAMPELHMLELDCNETVMTWLGQYSSNLCFSKLKILRLRFFNDVPTTFPYSFLQRIPTVDTLIVTNGLFEEIFPFERVIGEETQHGSGIHIKSLSLDKLPKLRHIWREGNELYPILKNLEEIFVLECSSLLNLVPSSVTFDHLTSLEICKCEGMLDLMASSTAKSLGQLTTMEIKECGMIKEIVADKVVGTIDEITFSNLKSIKLQNLPCLKSFCSINYVFKFPSLENVVIYHCPKMKKFSKGVSETPKLQNVQADKKDENCWEGNLNSTILKLYNDMIASGITRIEESESKENSSSHNSSQSSDHALSYVDTKGKNTHKNELDRNKQVEGTATTKNELVRGGKGVDEDRCTQEEAFDLQKERPEVEGVQVQLALDPEGGSVKEKGGHSSKTSEGMYAQSKAEDTDAEASRSSLLDTGVVTDQNKPSTPIGQNGDSTALDQGKKGTIHEGVVLYYNNEGVVSEGVSETPKLQNVQADQKDESCWEGNLNSTILKLYNDMVASGSTRSKESERKENSSSHSSSQGSDHVLSYMNTKGKNTHQNELDRNKQVEGTASIKNELVGSGKRVDEELSFGRTQEEAFDLQKETPEVEGLEVQLALESTDKGSNANIPDVDLHVDSHALRSSEAMLPSSLVNIHTGEYAQTRAKDTNVEASNASLPDTCDVSYQNKQSTLVGQNGNKNALGQGMKGTIHEGVVLGYSNEGVVSSQGIMGFGMPLVSISPSLPILMDIVELNKDHIALLRDAFARYPNLWEPREDFSARFHGWAYKTLADLLYFLRNESPVTITKEREKEFLVLCNEAIQFGFDKSWVEEMRKRIVKDPEVDHAQMRLMEILEKEQELRQEKEMLNEFLQGRRKKCFDFL